MRAAVTLLVAMGRVLIMCKYHRTNREFWKDDDAVFETGDLTSLGLRLWRSCLKRENRAGLSGGAAWSVMACFKLVFHE